MHKSSVSLGFDSSVGRGDEADDFNAGCLSPPPEAATASAGLAEPTSASASCSIAAASFAVIEAQQAAMLCWLRAITEVARCASLLAHRQMVPLYGEIIDEKTGESARVAEPQQELGLAPILETGLAIGRQPATAEDMQLREAVWAAELAQRRLAVARWRGKQGEAVTVPRRTMMSDPRIAARSRESARAAA